MYVFGRIVAATVIASAFSSLSAVAQGYMATPPNDVVEFKSRDATRTQPDEAGCFEIFVSPRQLRETYLLDECSGATWVIEGGEEELVWSFIPRESQSGATASERRIYQIISSGIAAKGTYLLNTDTGATWTMKVDPEKLLFWEAIHRN